VSEIWAACSGRATPVVLQGDICRLVESQEQVATNALVRTLAEQALLEDLIETCKPTLPQAASGSHYLLATPFRYPPLPWGSRFGRCFEPSLFYAARTTDTVLAESAYYRFVFWSGMATPPPAPLNTRHTLFSVAIGTRRGLQLQHPPFEAYAAALLDCRQYGATQALGSAMRDAGIEAFEYRSARDPRQGLNVALFTPDALAAAKPDILDEWLCQTTAERVSYYSRPGGGICEFPLETFLVDGQLPSPAP
jgi:RES domain